MGTPRHLNEHDMGRDISLPGPDRASGGPPPAGQRLDDFRLTTTAQQTALVHEQHGVAGRATQFDEGAQGARGWSHGEPRSIR